MGCGFENTLAVEVIAKCTAVSGETEKVALNDRILKKKNTREHFVLVRHLKVMLKIKVRTSRVSGNTRFYGSYVHLVYNHPHDLSRWLWDLLQNTCSKQKVLFVCRVHTA